MTKPDAINQLKAKLKEAWLRGKEQRIEIGTLLLELREQAEHGEWGKLLAELGIPASTAADYMVEASRQIHGIRVIGNVADPDAEAIEKAVNAAMVQVEQVASGADPVTTSAPIEPSAPAPIPIKPKKPKPPELDEHVRVSSPVLFCSADQKAAYKAAKKEDKARVYFIFHKALLEVIGEQEEVSDASVAA
jgi:hypothetical protein